MVKLVEMRHALEFDRYLTAFLEREKRSQLKVFQLNTFVALIAGGSMSAVRL